MKDPNENRPGYKRTKGGWIPKEWEYAQLTQVAQLESGHTPSREEPKYWSGNIPWVSLHDTDNLDGREITITKLTVSQDGINNSSARLLPAGTVIFSRTATVGKATILGREMATSQDFANFICGARLNNLFLVQLLRGMTRQWHRLMAGSTHSTIYMPAFKSLFIVLPPRREQIQISSILFTCDDAIERTRDLIATKKEQKKALMQRLLTGKQRLPGFKEKWARRKIGELLKEVTRPVDWDDNNEYSLLSVRRRSGGVFLRDRLKGSQIATKVMFIAHAGDFLISKMQVLHGATGLVPPDLDGCHISGSYIALRPNGSKLVAPAFFCRLSEMHEFRHLTYLCSYGVHIEKMTFNLDWFLDSKILIPSSVDEQCAIVDVFAAAAAEIKALENHLAALNEQKKGLMQKLLTGQIRVKV